MPNFVEQSPPEPNLVLYQGGDNDNNDDDEAPAPAPVPVDAPPNAPADDDLYPGIPLAAPPAHGDPDPDPDPDPAPAPAPPAAKHTNPPRTAHPEGTLNESILEKRQPQQPVLPPPPHPSPSPAPPSRSPSPDPLLIPPAQPVIPPVAPPPLSPPPSSDSDSEVDELLLMDNNSEDELNSAEILHAGLEYVAKEHEHLTWDQALDFTFSSVIYALKTSTHDGEPQTLLDYAEPFCTREKRT